jgi:hypothetical protein
MSDDKPRLIPIPTPSDVEAMRADLGQPFPIEYAGRWYAVSYSLTA